MEKMIVKRNKWANKRELKIKSKVQVTKVGINLI